MDANIDSIARFKLIVGLDYCFSNALQFGICRT